MKIMINGLPGNVAVMLVLVGRAHIDQHRRVAVLKLFVQFGRRDLADS